MFLFIAQHAETILEGGGFNGWYPPEGNHGNPVQERRGMILFKQAEDLLGYLYVY
jgi:hypothetical protein